jgi:DNA repair exonuclease SbcCD ATPase subunit
MDTEAPCKRGGATEKAPVAPESMTIGEKRMAEAKAAATSEASAPPVIPKNTRNEEETSVTTPSGTEAMTVGEKRAAEAKAAKAAESTNPVEEKPTPKLTVGQQRAAEAKAEKAKAEADAATIATTPEENTASNNGSVLTNTEEEDEPSEPIEEEKPPAETQCFTVQDQPTNKKTRLGDPTLPHLLRIGEDSTSEYIDFLPSSLVSTGGFNAIETGFAPKELPKLYNVYTTEGYAAMQRAFGVKDRQSRSPIHDYILKMCKFEGFDLVVKALEHRMCTLNEAIALKADTTKTKLNKHRLEYVKKLLVYMSKIKEPCVKEKPTKPIQTNAVPCLSDMNLLRDLTYLVVLLHGNADPSVKKQLESIPLKKLLDTVQKNNINKEETKTALAEAIKILYDSLKTAKDTGNEVPLDALKTIYSAVSQETPPENVTVPMVIEKIQSILKELHQKIETVKQCEKTEAKLADYEKQLASLLAKLDEVNTQLKDVSERTQTQFTTNATEIKELQEKRDVLQNQLTEALEKQTAAEVKSAQTSANAAAQTDSSETELQELRTKIGELTAKIGSLEAEKATISAKDAELESLRKQIETLEAQREALLQQGTETVKEQVDRLTDEINKLQEEYTKKSEELGKLRGEQFGDKAILEAEKAKTLRVHAELTAQIAALEASIRRLGEEHTTNMAAVTSAKVDLETKLAGNTVELEQLKASLAEANTKAARVNSLEQNLAAAERSLTAAEEDKEKRDADHTAALTELNEKIAAAEANATELDGKLRTCTEGAEDIERALAAATAEIETLNAELKARKASGSDAEKNFEDAKTTLNKEIAELKRQLDALTSEKEETSEKLSTCERKSGEKDAEIERLTTELDASKNREAGLTAAVARTTEEKTAKNTQIADLERQKADAITEKDKATSEKASIAAELAALTAQLNELKNSSDATCANKDTKIDELQTKIAELQQRPTKEQLDGLKSEVAAKAAQLITETSKIASLTGQIQTLSDQHDAQLEALENQLKDILQETKRLKDAETGTKTRLQNLLSMILIDDTLAENATKFVLSNDPPSEKLQGDLCDFFRYFSDMLNLQQQKLYSTRIPAEAKKDIFSIFTKSAPAYDKDTLLREISSLFQEVFMKLGKKETLENTVLAGSYPTVKEVLTIVDKTPLKAKYTTPEVLNEFISFGFLGLYGVDNSFTLRKKATFVEFTTDNTSNYTPLFILGIKLIQLLAESSRTKYATLADRCKISLFDGSDIKEPDRIQPAPVDKEYDAFIKQYDKSTLLKLSETYMKNIIASVNAMIELGKRAGNRDTTRIDLLNEKDKEKYVYYKKYLGFIKKYLTDYLAAKKSGIQNSAGVTTKTLETTIKNITDTMKWATSIETTAETTNMEMK